MKKFLITILMLTVVIVGHAQIFSSQHEQQYSYIHSENNSKYTTACSTFSPEIFYFRSSIMEISFTDNLSVTFIDWLDAGIGWTGKTYFAPNLFVGSYNGIIGKTTLDSGGLFSCMKFGPFFGSWNIWNDTWTGETVLGYSVNLRQNIMRYGMNIINLWYSDYFCFSAGVYIASYDSWVHDTSGNHIGWTNSNLQSAQMYNRNNTGKAVGIRLSAMIYCMEVGFSMSGAETQFDVSFTAKGILRHWVKEF